MKFDLKIMNIFKKPTAAALMRARLEECERGLVEQQAAEIYSRKMAEYYSENIALLQSQMGKGALLRAVA